jgi:hypothetical protein
LSASQEDRVRAIRQHAAVFLILLLPLFATFINDVENDRNDKYQTCYQPLPVDINT